MDSDSADGVPQRPPSDPSGPQVGTADGTTPRAPNGHSLATLERAVVAAIGAAGVPGLALALLEDGAVTWERQFGVRSIDAGPEVDGETVFEAASLAKPPVALAALLLCEHGLLDLDLPLSVLVPEYSAWGLDPDDPLLSEITARQVLSHSSGMGNWEPATIGRIGFIPGTRFAYSGEGYMYLQAAMEALTGLPLAAHMRASILGPLGMDDSSYAWRPDYSARAARGHGPRDEGAGSRWSEASAAFSLYTTAADYARFCRALLDPAPLGLGPALTAQMFRPQMRIDDALSWGLGWGLALTASGECFWQWGDLGDFQAYAIGSRAHRHALVVLTNGAGGLSVAARIATLAFSAEYATPIDWVLATGS